MPPEIDEVHRRVRQLEIERVSLATEESGSARTRLEELDRELAELNEQLTALNSRWQQEKEHIEAVQSAKEELERVRQQAHQAERDGDLEKAAELRYGRARELEQELHQAQEKIEALRAEGEPGISRVLCFSPRHDLTVARMDVPALRLVVDLWVAQFEDLAQREFINWVQIFENRGDMMGASNPHPHCQIWAGHSAPNEAVKEREAQRAYQAERGSCLLCDYAALESRSAARVVCENDGFLVVVPFWAVWPFETLLVSKRHFGGMDEFRDRERDDLAEILKRVTTRFDNLFAVPFPYTMGFHQRPTDGQPHPSWHFHAHHYPPLLRSATVRKFMVGYEMLAMPQRDITPEMAAERLRSLAKIHYKSQP